MGTNTRFLEELMAHIILVGGRKIEPAELKEMKLGELIDLITPNGLILSVEPRNY